MQFLFGVICDVHLGQGMVGWKGNHKYARGICVAEVFNVICTKCIMVNEVTASNMSGLTVLG